MLNVNEVTSVKEFIEFKETYPAQLAASGNPLMTALRLTREKYSWFQTAKGLFVVFPEDRTIANLRTQYKVFMDHDACPLCVHSVSVEKNNKCEVCPFTDDGLPSCFDEESLFDRLDTAYCNGVVVDFLSLCYQMVEKIKFRA